MASEATNEAECGHPTITSAADAAQRALAEKILAAGSAAGFIYPINPGRDVKEEAQRHGLDPYRLEVVRMAIRISNTEWRDDLGKASAALIMLDKFDASLRSSELSL